MKTAKLPLNIVLTGGGSGGHITPLLSLAHALKKADPTCQIIYIGQKGERLEKSLGERYRVFDQVRNISAGKFRRYHGESLLAHLIDVKTLFLNSRDFFKVIAGILQAKRILKQLHPNVVFSKGGFVAVPVGIAAHRLKIPIVTHDSDAAGGLANKIIGRYTNVHATGQPAGNYSYNSKNVHYVGIPVDERLRPVSKAMQIDFKRQLGLPADSLVLLVGGAGLGARRVNQLTVDISDQILSQFNNLIIFHLSGDMHTDEVKQKYKAKLGGQAGRVHVLGFTSDLYKYSGAADLVITRAGATTIAELALQHKATILIPAPQLAGGHQIKNADLLKKRQAAEVLSNDVSPNDLAQTCIKLLKSARLRQKLADNLGSTAKPNAAYDIAQLLIKTASEN